MKKLYPFFVADNKDDAKEGKKSNTIKEDSIISSGFLKGNSLDDVIETYLGNLLGDKVFHYFRGSLPIVMKRVQYAKDGDIVVSPNDETAFERWMCYGKDRVFYIIDSKKNSTLYIGFNEDISAQKLYDLVLKGDVKNVMNHCAVEKGEVYYISANTPFCIGKGIELIEISQNSPIELNINDYDQFVEALDFINLGKYIPQYSIPQDHHWSIDTIRLRDKTSIEPNEFESFIFLHCINGDVILKLKNHEDIKLKNGETIIVPQEIDQIEIINEKQNNEATLLRVYLKGIDLSDMINNNFNEGDSNDKEHGNSEGHCEGGCCSDGHCEDEHCEECDN